MTSRDILEKALAELDAAGRAAAIELGVGWKRACLQTSAKASASKQKAIVSLNGAPLKAAELEILSSHVRMTVPDTKDRAIAYAAMVERIRQIVESLLEEDPKFNLVMTLDPLQDWSSN